MRIKCPIELMILRKLLDYNPSSGLFTNKVTRHSHAVRGSVAGSPKTGGYIQIQIFNTAYPAHRLAWFYTHGVWPENQIDHINGIRDDNRICNLRVVNQSENSQNKRCALSNNKSGFLGVSKAGNRWRATITIKRKKVHIGYFSSPDDAHVAYINSKRKNHTTCSI